MKLCGGELLCFDFRKVREGQSSGVTWAVLRILDSR